MEYGIGSFHLEKCCVPNCEDLYSKRHQFPGPDKEPELFKMWIDKVKHCSEIKLMDKFTEIILCVTFISDEFKEVSHRGLSKIANPTILLGLSDDDKENTVPAKRAKTDEIVDEVTKEPVHRLETLFPINPSEGTSQDFT
ncbi:hypothetical protein JTB14_038287 [Gonioctena quinquepunctata]|nr:hypothetical protein JTB14_038287 [Gonioctena quinquepunctata]